MKLARTTQRKMAKQPTDQPFKQSKRKISGKVSGKKPIKTSGCEANSDDKPVELVESNNCASKRERPSNYSINKSKKVEKEADLKMYRHKVFIDGLPYQRSGETDAQLFDFCVREGVKGAIRLVQKKGYGFGYLVFHTNEQAKRAVQRLAGKSLFGRKLRIEQPKAPDPEKAKILGNRNKAREIFNRQILLFNLPRFVNDEVLADALNDHLKDTVFTDSIQYIKTVRHGKAFITFKENFERQLPAILTIFKENPFSILGNTIQVVQALPPHEGSGKILQKLPTQETCGAEKHAPKKPRDSCNDELLKLMKLSKSKSSYSFLLEELGEPSRSNTFRSQFHDRFEIQDMDEIIELSPVRSHSDFHLTGLWKVIVRSYLTVYKIFARCSAGNEEGKFRVELC